MFDQHSNAPAYLEKISLGCLEINYADLKYSEYWNNSITYHAFFATFISFDFTICLIFTCEFIFLIIVFHIKVAPSRVISRR